MTDRSSNRSATRSDGSLSGYVCQMRSLGLVVMTLAAFAGCGGDKGVEADLATHEADLPTHVGQLWALCPAPDVPRGFYEQQSADARRAIEALIREVRRDPDDVVTLVSRDADTGHT